MKNVLMLFVFICFTAAFAVAQSPLYVKSGDKGLYLEHKVAAKENFYSIGRLYNVHPKFLAAYNKLNMSKGLSLGQQINVPLTDTNFTQKNTAGTPVYYMVGEKEGLYRVSVKNKNVLMQSLRDWNHLTSDNISNGQSLIVGYLISAEMKNQPMVMPEKPVVVAEEKKQEVKKEEEVVKPAPKHDEIKDEEKKEEQQVEKTEPKVPVKKEEIKKPEPVIEEKKTAQQGEGYFKTSFEQQVKQQPTSKDATVTSGIFKTTSGWNDQKYYLLMDGVDPGTIIRIVNPSNNKIIYAKVLGEMAGIRQNQGVSIRISNAAAAALDVEDTDKFILRIVY